MDGQFFLEHYINYRSWGRSALAAACDLASALAAACDLASALALAIAFAACNLAKETTGDINITYLEDITYIPSFGSRLTDLK